MIIEVEMHAFAGGAIRRVTIPDHEIEPRPPREQSGAFDRWRGHVLGLVFHYGQNDFCLLDDRGQELPSVSVGDIVRVLFVIVGNESLAQALAGAYDERYAVLPVGWRRVEPDFTPPHDGGMWAYAEAATREAQT